MKADRPHRSNAVIAVLGLAAALGTCRTASAQSAVQSATKLANEEFTRGQEAMKQGKLNEAITAFEAGQRAQPRTGTLLNLAWCREHNGQLATAWRLFMEGERVTRGASDSKNKAWHQTALDGVNRIKPQLSRLTITVPDEKLVNALTIQRGAEAAETVERARWNRASAVDGGTYRIIARGAAGARWTTEITVAVRSDNKVVTVSISGPKPAPTTPDGNPSDARTRRMVSPPSKVQVVPERVHAQPSGENASAEQLFNQGRDLVKENRWPEACSKFEASLLADPVLGTRLNLATCYEHIGKLASAWGMFREAIEPATKAGEVKRRDDAEKQADALEPRLPQLTIWAPTNPPAGFVAAWDGVPIDASALGVALYVALYVDPGAHTLTASAPGFEAFTQTVTLVEGQAEALAVPALRAVPVRATALPPAPSKGLAATPQTEIVISPTRKYVAIAIGGTGVASIGLGLLFGYNANAAYDDAKARCGSNLVCSIDNYSRGQQLIRDTRSDATIATVLVAAGSAAIVTGAVVWLTGRQTRERANARLVPVIHDRGGGLAVTGRF